MIFKRLSAVQILTLLVVVCSMVITSCLVLIIVKLDNKENIFVTVQQNNAKDTTDYNFIGLIGDGNILLFNHYDKTFYVLHYDERDGKRNSSLSLTNIKKLNTVYELFKDQ